MRARALSLSDEKNSERMEVSGAPRGAAGASDRRGGAAGHGDDGVSWLRSPSSRGRSQ